MYKVLFALFFSIFGVFGLQIPLFIVEKRGLGTP